MKDVQQCYVLLLLLLSLWSPGLWVPFSWAALLIKEGHNVGRIISHQRPLEETGVIMWLCGTRIFQCLSAVNGKRDTYTGCSNCCNLYLTYLIQYQYRLLQHNAYAYFIRTLYVCFRRPTGSALRGIQWAVHGLFFIYCCTWYRYKFTEASVWGILPHL